ncbi:hypothetical protein ACSQ67_025863 [Phaseolus vulgaris]
MAGDGGVDAVGEGGMVMEETVRGKVVPGCLGKGREGRVQDHLRGPLNVHDNSLRERVALVGGHGSLSFSKKEKVDSYVEVASSKESKSADEKARSNGGVGVSRCTLSGSVRAGASFQAPPREPFLEVGVQEINDGGTASLKDGCHEEEEVEVGTVSRRTSLVSRVADLVADSVGIRPSLHDLERCWDRRQGDRDVKAERRWVRLPPGGQSEVLGAGLEDEVEGGGNNGDMEGEVPGLDGEVVGR